MALYGKTVTKREGYWILKVQNLLPKSTKSSLAQLQTVLGIHLSDFTYILLLQYTETNFMCNINHPKFPSKICAKNVQDKYKVLQCDLCELWMTFVKFGFILNVTTFII